MPDDQPKLDASIGAIKAEGLLPNDDAALALATAERAQFEKPSEDKLKLKAPKHHDDRRIEIELDDLAREVENRALYTGRLFWLMVAWM